MLLYAPSSLSLKELSSSATASYTAWETLWNTVLRLQVLGPTSIRDIFCMSSSIKKALLVLPNPWHHRREFRHYQDFYLLERYKNMTAINVATASGLLYCKSTCSEWQKTCSTRKRWYAAILANLSTWLLFFSVSWYDILDDCITINIFTNKKKHLIQSKNLLHMLRVTE